MSGLLKTAETTDRPSMDLSPEQFSSLKRVVAAPAAKVAAITGGTVGDLETLMGRVETVARKRATTLGNERLLLIHDPSAKGSQALDDAAVANLLRAKTPVVKIGSDCGMISAAKGDVSTVTAAIESEIGPRMTVLVAAGQFTVFAGGKPIAEIGVPPPAQHGRSDWKRSWRELPMAMNDHFKHCIDDEKSVRYWKDKKKRLLLAGPDGTEKIFHQSLYWWLDHMLSDAIDVYGETLGMGQIKTDITVVTEVGLLVIEVKWMGKNESGTSYKEIRIREGLAQVALYLAKNDKIFGAYVVLYDARPENVHKTSCTFPETSVVNKCERPIIYFLPSETPSQTATRVAGAT